MMPKILEVLLKIFVLISTLLFSSAVLASTTLTKKELVSVSQKLVKEKAKYNNNTIEFIGNKFTRSQNHQASTVIAYAILSAGYQKYIGGNIELSCDKSECMVFDFQETATYKECTKPRKRNQNCFTRTKREINPYQGSDSSTGPSGWIFEEHDSRTSPGYSGGGNDSNHPAYDERSSHHLDQPRNGGNEIDGVHSEF